MNQIDELNTRLKSLSYHDNYLGELQKDLLQQLKFLRENNKKRESYENYIEQVERIRNERHDLISSIHEELYHRLPFSGKILDYYKKRVDELESNNMNILAKIIKSNTKKSSFSSKFCLPVPLPNEISSDSYNLLKSEIDYAQDRLLLSRSVLDKEMSNLRSQREKLSNSLLLKANRVYDHFKEHECARTYQQNYDESITDMKERRMGLIKDICKHLDMHKKLLDPESSSRLKLEQFCGILSAVLNENTSEHHLKARMESLIQNHNIGPVFNTPSSAKASPMIQDSIARAKYIVNNKQPSSPNPKSVKEIQELYSSIRKKLQERPMIQSPTSK